MSAFPDLLRSPTVGDRVDGRPQLDMRLQARARCREDARGTERVDRTRRRARDPRRLRGGGRPVPASLVLEGEAGIGKTALWVAGVEAAEAAGCTVLAARPAEAETKLAHTVLRDLLGPSFAQVSPELPAPQRQALEAALLLSRCRGRGRSRCDRCGDAVRAARASFRPANRRRTR